jgi:curved DNA-binding protein CbpA
MFYIDLIIFNLYNYKYKIHIKFMEVLLMNINYFTGVTTIEELKKAYRQLAKKFHPDLNRDTDTTKQMQDINNEYEYLFSRLGTESDKKNGHNVNDSFRDIINELMKEKYAAVTVEIVGSWIWLSGNTYNVKEQIKELGFSWSKPNKKWYFAGSELKGKKKGSLNWDQKISKYGLNTIKEGKQSKQAKLA